MFQLVIGTLFGVFFVAPVLSTPQIEIPEKIHDLGSEILSEVLKAVLVGVQNSV